MTLTTYLILSHIAFVIVVFVAIISILSERRHAKELRSVVKMYAQENYELHKQLGDL